MKMTFCGPCARNVKTDIQWAMHPFISFYHSELFRLIGCYVLLHVIRLESSYRGKPYFN